MDSAGGEVEQLMEAWTEFLSRWHWDWFATLTFRSEVHPESAGKQFRLWVSKMNRELYGIRWYKHEQGVRWVRALEMQRRDVIHYHSLMGGEGLGGLRRLSWMDEWEKIAGYARIEPPRDQDAVRSYCSKYVIKGGEIDIGGPGMHDLPPSSYPHQLRRVRWTPIESEALLGDIRQNVTPAEYEDLVRWASTPHAGEEPPQVLSALRREIGAERVQ